MYLELTKKNEWITTYNQLDLETLGFWAIMPKILPGHMTPALEIEIRDWINYLGLGTRNYCNDMFVVNSRYPTRI
jgi:hypothetical protein